MFFSCINRAPAAEGSGSHTASRGSRSLTVDMGGQRLSVGGDRGEAEGEGPLSEREKRGDKAPPPPRVGGGR